MERTVCLVVEDEPTVRRLIQTILDEVDCDVVGVPDAEAAIRVMEEQRPHFILCDIRLPGMDGVELVRRIRQDPRLSSLPVILISAYGEPDGHSADGFVAKPFDPDVLLEIVKPYVSG